MPGAVTQLYLGGGTTKSVSFTWDNDGTNCIGFFDYDNVNSQYSKIDNFNVYSGLLGGAMTIPEPSTLALLAAGLAGLLCYAWRKRK